MDESFAVGLKQTVGKCGEVELTLLEIIPRDVDCVIKTSTYLVTNKQLINSKTYYIARETQMVSQLETVTPTAKKDKAIKEIKLMRSKRGSHSSKTCRK